MKYEFEYVSCEGEVMEVGEAIDLYGYSDAPEKCSDIVMAVTIEDAETWKEAKEKMIKMTREIIIKHGELNASQPT